VRGTQKAALRLVGGFVGTEAKTWLVEVIMFYAVFLSFYIN
jgi:hypothetical protein